MTDDPLTLADALADAVDAFRIFGATIERVQAALWAEYAYRQVRPRRT